MAPAPWLAGVWDVRNGLGAASVRHQGGAPLAGVVAGDHDGGVLAEDRSVGELGRDRPDLGGLVNGVEDGGGGGGAFDLLPVDLQPLRLVEGDRPHGAAPVAVGGDEAAVGDRAL